MFYIGMDLHKKRTVYCVLDQSGAVIERGNIASAPDEWLALVSKWPVDQLKVVFETGSLSLWLYDLLAEHKITSTVVDARKFKLIALSRKKSDRRDAYLLADGLRCGMTKDCAISIPSARAREGRMLLQSRHTVVKTATITCNAARGLLRTVGLSLSKRGFTSEKQWEIMIEHPAIPSWMKPLLAAHRSVWTEAMRQRTALEILIRESMSSSWEEQELLLPLPGFGPIVTLTVLSSIDDPHRFSRARDAGSYAGLVPSCRDSGETTRRGRITREGRSILRHVIVQAGHTAMRSRALSPALRKWATKLAMNKGRQVAAVALGRRLLVLAVKLWQNGEVYNAKFGEVQAAAA